MPTITTTVTSACASGATQTVTTTEATPENSGLTRGGDFSSWVVKCPASVAKASMQFDTMVEKLASFSGGLITKWDANGNTPGSARNIWMQGSDEPFVETLVAAGEDGYSYTIENGWFSDSLGCKDYVGTFNIVAVNASTCVISWTNTYRCADPAATKAALAGFGPLFTAFMHSHEAESGYTWDGMFNTFAVNAPADKVGPLIQFDTFMALEKPPGAIASYEVDGGHVGATRTIQLEGGGTVVEKCCAQDASGYSYYMPEGGEVDYGEPFKLHGYLGTMSVAAVTATTSVVTWTNTYQTCDAAHSKAALNGFVPLIKAMFETIPAKASSVL